MLQCKTAKTTGVEITDKKITVNCSGPVITLGEQTFESPGEYESDGIEIVYGQTAALIVWERLQIVYVFGDTNPTGFESGQFSSCDVLVIGRTGNIDKAAVTPLLESYDPTVVVVSAQTTLETALKETLKTVDADLVKLAVATLPVEGRETYQLQ